MIISPCLRHCISFAGLHFKEDTDKLQLEEVYQARKRSENIVKRSMTISGKREDLEDSEYPGANIRRSNL